MESIFKGIRDAFSSGTEVVMFAVVVGGALVFAGYLVLDGYYHRRKWRRLQRRFKEGAASENVDAG